MIHGAVRPVGRRADPQVPVEIRREGRSLHRAHLSSRIDGVLGPDVNFADGPMAPDRSISAVPQAASLAQVCTLIWVATPASRAAATTMRASATVWVTGFAQ